MRPCREHRADEESLYRGRSLDIEPDIDEAPLPQRDCLEMGHDSNEEARHPGVFSIDGSRYLAHNHAMIKTIEFLATLHRGFIVLCIGFIVLAANATSDDGPWKWWAIVSMKEMDNNIATIAEMLSRPMGDFYRQQFTAVPAPPWWANAVASAAFRPTKLTARRPPRGVADEVRNYLPRMPEMQSIHLRDSDISMHDLTLLPMNAAYGTRFFVDFYTLSMPTYEAIVALSREELSDYEAFQGDDLEIYIYSTDQPGERSADTRCRVEFFSAGRYATHKLMPSFTVPCRLAETRELPNRLGHLLTTDMTYASLESAKSHWRFAPAVSHHALISYLEAKYRPVTETEHEVDLLGLKTTQRIVLALSAFIIFAGLFYMLAHVYIVSRHINELVAAAAEVEFWFGLFGNWWLVAIAGSVTVILPTTAVLLTVGFTIEEAEVLPGLSDVGAGPSLFDKIGFSCVGLTFLLAVWFVVWNSILARRLSATPRRKWRLPRVSIGESRNPRL